MRRILVKKVRCSEFLFFWGMIFGTSFASSAEIQLNHGCVLRGEVVEVDSDSIRIRQSRPDPQTGESITSETRIPRTSIRKISGRVPRCESSLNSEKKIESNPLGREASFPSSLSRDRTEKGGDFSPRQSDSRGKAKIERMHVSIPGLGWRISFEGPSITEFESEKTEVGFRCLGHSEDGFHISIFVEEKRGEGPKAWADFSWSYLKKSPFINFTTVTRQEEKDYVRIAYRMRIEHKDQTILMPHEYIYFPYRDRWVAVHISKLPFAEEDQKIFDTLVRSIRFEDESTSTTSPSVSRELKPSFFSLCKAGTIKEVRAALREGADLHA